MVKKCLWFLLYWCTTLFLKTHLLIVCKFEHTIFMSHCFKVKSQESIIAQVE